MSKFTDAVRDTLIGHFNAGDQPTEAQFTELITKIQEGIEEHDHDATGDGDGIADLGPLDSLEMADDAWIGIGAALERIVFDATGDIAVMGANFSVGTLTPVALVDVYKTVSGGDGATLFLRNDGTLDGSTTTLYFGYGSGHTLPDVGAFRIQQTGWPGGITGGDLSFDERTGAAAWTTRMFIQRTTGYVGVNEPAPSYRFDVLGDRAGSFIARFFNDGDDVGRYGIIIQAGGEGADVGTTYFLMARDHAAAATGALLTTDGVFSLADMSDERCKTNIVDTKMKGLEIINGLRVRDYNWKANPDGPVMTSFVAQEAQKVFPGDVEGTLMTSRAILIPILTKAIQEQQAQIKELQGRVK
jgi:hypothetical protein